MSLLDALNAAGLVVRAANGWETRTQSARTREGKTVTDRPYTTSIVWHWDAIKSAPLPSYYISGNRYGGLIYHIVVRRDGTLDLLGQRIAWNAGSNFSGAHDELKEGRTPPRPTEDDDMSGNPYTFSLCANYHPDYEPMTAECYTSMVAASAVLVEHLDLSVPQVVDHSNLTRRKFDVSLGQRFPGGTVDMDIARAEILAILEPDEPIIPPPVPEPPDMTTEQFVKRLTPDRIDELVAAGVILGDPTGAYWKKMLATPDNPEWENVMEEIEVMARVRAATGKVIY